MRLQLKIIELLTKENSLTINQIAKKLNETYSFVNRTIHGMIKEQLILKEKIGHSILCRLNKNNDKTKALMILNEVNKKQEFLKKNIELKFITDEILEKIQAESVGIFGSYAKKTQTRGSDIDLFILAKRKFDTTNLVRNIHAKYGKEISPIVINRLDKEKPITKEIIKNHIILAGFEKFINET